MDPFVRHLAAQWFHKHAGRLAKQLPGVRKAEDIECVHRARVASRRLRTALRLFPDWGSSKQHARWRKHLRRVGKKLSAARDIDVQLLLLCRCRPETNSLSVPLGLAHLILRWGDRRETLQKKVIRAVRRLQRSSVLEEIQKHSERILKRHDFSEAVFDQSPLWEGAVQQLQHDGADLFRYAPCLEDPEDQQGHHAMRIAAKRLRYTLEMLEPLLGVEIQPTIEALQTFQTLLGEVHDCDVWQEQLADLQETVGQEDVAGRPRKQNKKDSEQIGERIQAAIRWLQEDRRQARDRLFQEAVAHWRRCLQAEVGERLPALLQRAYTRPGRTEVSRPRHLLPPGSVQEETSPPEPGKGRDQPRKYRSVHW